MNKNEKVEKYGVEQTGTFPFGTAEFKFYQTFFRNVVRSAIPSSTQIFEGELEGEAVRYKLSLQDVANLSEFTNFKIPDETREDGVRSDIWGVKIRFYGGNGARPYVKIKWLYGRKGNIVQSLDTPRKHITPTEVLEQYSWISAMTMDCMTAVSIVVDGVPKDSTPPAEYEDAIEHIAICYSDLCHDCREAYDLP